MTSLNLLNEGMQELGVPMTSSQEEAFQTYYNELCSWNERINLTSIIDYFEVQVKHFLDSLTLLLAFDAKEIEDAKVIDVGTGAGFPGLPLKIMFPSLDISLIDSVGKKTGFLNHLLSRLNLSGVKVFTDRAEQLAHDPNMRERFDFVLARAVARMPVLLEYTLPFCAVGGKVVAWKHGGIEEELSESVNASRLLGGSEHTVCDVNLTSLQDNRILVIVEKTSLSPVRYPRRAGLAKKSPI